MGLDNSTVGRQMKIWCRSVAIFLIALAPPGWASCTTNLLASDVGSLPGQHRPLGCSSDDPTMSKECDWTTTVQNDRSIGSVRRLVLLNSNHETGSGTNQHLTVYGCVAGKPTVVLDKDYINGAHIGSVTKNTIIVVSAAWAKKDPMCCPSLELRQVFSWSPSKNAYVLKRSTRHLRKQR